MIVIIFILLLVNLFQSFPNFSGKFNLNFGVYSKSDKSQFIKIKIATKCMKSEKHCARYLENCSKNFSQNFCDYSKKLILNFDTFNRFNKLFLLYIITYNSFKYMSFIFINLVAPVIIYLISENLKYK